MLFNSVKFAVFLPIVFCAYWLLPHKYRWVLLLVGSYYFYMSWNPKYIFLILFTTFISFYAALVIEKRSSNIYIKKVIVICVAVVCLGVLCYFKYFNFLSKAVGDALKLITIDINSPVLDVILPVGISFYTFQALGYVIDVHKGKVSAESHLGHYATFISFFPLLLAGPIERANRLLPQIKEERFFDYTLATYGLKQMAWGFFKKLVIADNLAVCVDLIYNDVYSYSGSSLIVATIFFTFQIYCDFSGYSDIAIGTSKLFGINLMTNFRSPYFAQSLTEFWSRWHISLSTWFRDYVYIPLGGNRKGKRRTSVNLLSTFILSGLWQVPTGLS